MTNTQLSDMIYRYNLCQSSDREGILVYPDLDQSVMDEIRAAKPELLSFFNSARERRDHDEARRGSDCFDYIPMLDNRDPERLARLYSYHSVDDEDEPKDFPCASARQRSPEGWVGGICFNRFARLPGLITVSWCKEFAEDAAYITGIDICRVDVHIRNGEYATYDTEKNILRIFRGVYGREELVYENDNGQIWRP